MTSTYDLVRNNTALAGIGSPWLSTRISPIAAVLLNPDNGTVAWKDGDVLTRARLTRLHVVVPSVPL